MRRHWRSADPPLLLIPGIHYLSAASTSLHRPQCLQNDLRPAHISTARYHSAPWGLGLLLPLILQKRLLIPVTSPRTLLNGPIRGPPASALGWIQATRSCVGGGGRLTWGVCVEGRGRPLKGARTRGKSRLTRGAQHRQKRKTEDLTHNK